MKNTKLTKKCLALSILSAASVAQATPLLDADLNNQSIYTLNYLVTGADSNVGGNMQSVTTATLGANTVVGGYLETGTTSTIGAGSTVNGYVYSGTTSTTGVDSIIMGNLSTGTTATLGAGSTVGGNIRAGGAVTRGVGDTVTGTVEQNLAGTLGYSAPEVTIQTTQIAAAQQTLKAMGAGTLLNSITFGTNDETLTAGIYSTLNYLTIAGGKTLTLDGGGVDSTFLFNISNYLTFAAGAKVELINFTDESAIIWNVLGDKVGSAGYTEFGIGAVGRGFIFSRGYVGSGADVTLTGVGNYCGGIFSGENYVGLGARNTIGTEGCLSGSVTTFDALNDPDNRGVPVPATFWLFGSAFIGLLGVARRKKAQVIHS
ncbi:MAG: hypothetical protein ACI9A2_004424 [Halioglobus sp.]|jgi:hypothetical protein